jgi:hypothetical protein
MTKRQMPDLSKLLATTATPMPDATEPQAVLPRPATNDREDATQTAGPPASARQTNRGVTGGEAATANLENLNFKVPKSFRKRFRDCAYKADLKHNELLFAALDAWETLNGRKN